jgi:hypothetical protein
MDKRLSEYLERNKAFFDSVIQNGTGYILRVVPHLIETNPCALLKLVSDLERSFRGRWQGTLANCFYVPCQNDTQQSNKAEYTLGQSEAMSQNKNDAYSDVVINVKTANGYFPIFAKVPTVLFQNETATQDAEKETAIMKLKNYFLPSQEVQNSITLLIHKGLSHEEIATQVGTSRSTIYRLSCKKYS